MDNEIAIREMNRLREKMSKGITLDETLYEAVTTAVKALDKQMPKLTINCKCPTCSEIIVGTGYCKNCGQKIGY